MLFLVAEWCYICDDDCVVLFRLMEQWNVVNTIQQDLDKWMNNTQQALSSEVVDTQVALSQQVLLDAH